MKKLYILLAFLCLGSAVSAQPYIGDVLINCNNIEERNGQLVIDLDIHIDAVAMEKRQSWTVTPEITSADKQMVMEFPYILVNGKNKRQMYERKLRFENTELLSDMPYMVVNVDHDTDTTLHYVMQVPYQDWMRGGDLQIRQVLTSCRDMEQLFLINVEKYVGNNPLMAYLVKPRVCFLTPEHEYVEGEAVVSYRLDRTDLDRTYMDNSEELAEVRALTEQIYSRGDLDIEKLEIEGYASPEGPYQRNVRLSQERAERLKNYIKTTFNIPEEMFETRSVAEDWKGLRELVAESNLSEKRQILDIIDSNDSYDVKERRIKALGGGAPYRVMLSEMLPKLRRAEYRITYSLRDYDDESFAILLNKRPQDLTHRELFLISQHLADDSDQFNVIFVDMMNRYGDRPEANCNAAAYMLMRGDHNSARNYLNRAGETPQTWNNLGVYYMHNGDLDKAEEMFIRAANHGVSEADYNLSELRRKLDFDSMGY